MKWNTITPVALVAMLAPVLTMAHEGHGTFSGHELAHYLTSPQHAAPTLVILAMAVLLFREYRKTQSQRS